MPQVPFSQSANSIDLSSRFVSSSTVVASPATSAETIICQVTIPDFGSLQLASGVRIHGSCSFTMGTSGTAATLRIRQTNVSGTVVVSTGAVTGVAGGLYCPDVVYLDPLPSAAVYCLTLQITAGAGASTVSEAHVAVTVI